MTPWAPLDPPQIKNGSYSPLKLPPLLYLAVGDGGRFGVGDLLPRWRSDLLLNFEPIKCFLCACVGDGDVTGCRPDRGLPVGEKHDVDELSENIVKK